MKPIAIAGIVLTVIGAFVLLRGLSYGEQHNVLKVGDLKVTAEERHAVPAWAGGLAIVSGLVHVLLVIAVVVILV